MKPDETPENVPDKFAMNEVSLCELLKRAQIFRDERNWKQFHLPKDLAAGLAVEAGELQELFLWKKTEEIAGLLHEPGFKHRLGEELADVLLFVLYLSDACQIDLREAFESKMERNAQKYPIHLSYNSNRKYTELQRSIDSASAKGSQPGCPTTPS